MTAEDSDAGLRAAVQDWRERLLLLTASRRL